MVTIKPQSSQYQWKVGKDTFSAEYYLSKKENSLCLQLSLYLNGKHIYKKTISVEHASPFDQQITQNRIELLEKSQQDLNLSTFTNEPGILEERRKKGRKIQFQLAFSRICQTLEISISDLNAISDKYCQAIEDYCQQLTKANQEKKDNFPKVKKEEERIDDFLPLNKSVGNIIPEITSESSNLPTSPFKPKTDLIFSPPGSKKMIILKNCLDSSQENIARKLDMQKYQKALAIAISLLKQQINKKQAQSTHFSWIFNQKLEKIKVHWMKQLVELLKKLQKSLEKGYIYLDPISAFEKLLEQLNLKTTFYKKLLPFGKSETFQLVQQIKKLLELTRYLDLSGLLKLPQDTLSIGDLKVTLPVLNTKQKNVAKGLDVQKYQKTLEHAIEWARHAHDVYQQSEASLCKDKTDPLYIEAKWICILLLFLLRAKEALRDGRIYIGLIPKEMLKKISGKKMRGRSQLEVSIRKLEKDLNVNNYITNLQALSGLPEPSFQITETQQPESKPEQKNNSNLRPS